ncbi:MAG: exonuclease SbcCD subunit D [Clostridia bacterium]|nr:exonuclease SbcCD subunit D [Clostridia bacterium]
MKLIHISDLHLGKRVNEFPMLDDQRYILDEIINITEETDPLAVLIAGDVYDSHTPPAEAVSVLDEFITRLAELGTKVFLISGNHDSADRIAFGSRIFRHGGIYVSPVFDGNIAPVTLDDDYGHVNFYMLPFIKPAHARAKYPDEEILSYTDAIGAAIRHMGIDPAERNVLITHQLVTGAVRCDSETVSVGGSDNVDVSVFDGFDYVALGHLHGPQSAGRDEVRYSGSPLKYSFSECSHIKSVTVIDLGEKGDISIDTIPLAPKHDMRELRGSYSELTLRKNYINTAREDHLHITLTDEDEIPDAIGKLRVIYPNIMRLDYDNTRTRHDPTLSVAEAEAKSPLDLFCDFYKQRNGRDMTEEEESFINALIEKIWEEKE